MFAAIPFPHLSNELFGLHLALRWYALAYIVGILIAWWLTARALRTPRLWRRETPPFAPAQLEDLITWYLSLEEGGPDLVCVVLDAKVGLTDLDREFSKIAIDQGRLLLVLVNKLDKINQKAQAALKRSLQGELGTEVTIFYYSAKTGKHLNIINNYLFGGEDPQEVLS